MRKLLVRLSLFAFVLGHAELVSASRNIAETFVSASSVVYHNACEKDVSAYSVVTEGHTAPIAIGVILASSSFDENVYSKDSLKQATRDSIKADTVYHHSYKKAALWSTFIPGAGQIYNEFGYRKIPQKKNRAWWKVPIIYGILGTAGYYFHQYTVTSKRLKDEWIYRNDSLGTFLYSDYEFWTLGELIDGKAIDKVDKNGNLVYDEFGDVVQIESPGFDVAAKRRDLIIFGFAAIWGLQIVEALVDAHFVTFDVSEDLTFSWSPTMLSYSTPGVTLRLEID